VLTAEECVRNATFEPRLMIEQACPRQSALSWPAKALFPADLGRYIFLLLLCFDGIRILCGIDGASLRRRRQVVVDLGSAVGISRESYSLVLTMAPEVLG
jgi:hypothetical protein